MHVVLVAILLALALPPAGFRDIKKKLLDSNCWTPNRRGARARERCQRKGRVNTGATARGIGAPEGKMWSATVLMALSMSKV